MDIFRTVPFERGLIDQLTNLADTLTDPPYRRSQYQEADLRCREALEKACNTGSLHLPGVLADCAYIPTMTGDLTRAAVMYTDAIQAAAKRKDKLAAAIAKGNLAFVEHALGHLDEAARLYNESLGSSSKLGETDADLAETNVRYARLLSDLGTEAKASELFKAATGQMTAKDLGYLLEDIQHVIKANPNPAAWGRIVAHPSQPLPPPQRTRMECTRDDFDVTTLAAGGAVIPLGTRPRFAQPPNQNIETCRRLAALRSQTSMSSSP